MKSVYVEAIGVCAPGLPDWGTCLRVLRGQVEYLPIDISELVPLSLGPNERRRTTPQIKLALHVAEQAVAHSMSNIEGLVATFASSEGDLQVVDKVCAALIQPGRPVSPMQFHNIVHNAPAGYWSIGHHASNCSTSIAASNDTFLAGLLYAYSTLIAEEVPVLLVCSDHPGPNVLNKYRPVSAAFGVAMIMMPERSPQCHTNLSLELAREGAESRMQNALLERLRVGNPAGRALTLLKAIASGQSERVVVKSLGEMRLIIDVCPATYVH